MPESAVFIGFWRMSQVFQYQENLSNINAIRLNFCCRAGHTHSLFREEFSNQHRVFCFSTVFSNSIKTCHIAKSTCNCLSMRATYTSALYLPAAGRFPLRCGVLHHFFLFGGRRLLRPPRAHICAQGTAHQSLDRGSPVSSEGRDFHPAAP